MQRVLILAALAMGLVSLGFVVGRAQSSEPAFELVVDAPGGDTTVRCVRGCTLAWVERGFDSRRSKPISEFAFGCTGSPRCGSGRVGGWTAP